MMCRMESLLYVVLRVIVGESTITFGRRCMFNEEGSKRIHEVSPTRGGWFGRLHRTTLLYYFGRWWVGAVRWTPVEGCCPYQFL